MREGVEIIRGVGVWLWRGEKLTASCEPDVYTARAGGSLAKKEPKERKRGN